jgi:hypothetical protein
MADPELIVIELAANTPPIEMLRAPPAIAK